LVFYFHNGLKIKTANVRILIGSEYINFGLKNRSEDLSFFITKLKVSQL